MKSGKSGHGGKPVHDGKPDNGGKSRINSEPDNGGKHGNGSKPDNGYQPCNFYNGGKHDDDACVVMAENARSGQ